MSVIAPPRPKGTLCKIMCNRCPFRSDGTGYAQDHPDLPRIVQSVEAGMPFYCHETVILDPRTTLGADGEPSPRMQPHFELCRGAWERYLAKWRERTIAGGHRGRSHAWSDPQGAVVDMSKKHERNLRYLARAEAYARIAADALHQVGFALSQLEIGPSAGPALAAQNAAEHRMREIEAQLAKLEKLVCS